MVPAPTGISVATGEVSSTIPLSAVRKNVNTASNSYNVAGTLTQQNTLPTVQPHLAETVIQVLATMQNLGLYQINNNCDEKLAVNLQQCLNMMRWCIRSISSVK